MDILIVNAPQGECRFEDETLWLSQTMTCDLYGKAKATIGEHYFSSIF